MIRNLTSASIFCVKRARWSKLSDWSRLVSSFPCRSNQREGNHVQYVAQCFTTSNRMYSASSSSALSETAPHHEKEPMNSSDGTLSVDEDSWIWHTGKKDLQRLSVRELIEMCRRHEISNERNRIEDFIQSNLETSSFNKAKLINKMINERNVQRKADRKRFKDFKAKLHMRPEEKDFYDSHTLEEIRALCKVYSVQTARTSLHKMIRKLLKKKATVTAEEEAIMEHHGNQLKHYCRELGIEVKKSTTAKLSMARRLNRLRKMNCIIHERLVRRTQEQNDVVSLPPDLQIDNVSNWKDQLFFYDSSEKCQTICELLGIEWERTSKKKKGAKKLREICRKLKIKFQEL